MIKSSYFVILVLFKKLLKIVNKRKNLVWEDDNNDLIFLYKFYQEEFNNLCHSSFHRQLKSPSSKKYNRKFQDQQSILKPFIKMIKKINIALLLIPHQKRYHILTSERLNTVQGHMMLSTGKISVNRSE